MTQTLGKADIATIFSKGLVGAIPFVGTLAAEIIGATIPDQRIDRIETFLFKLDTKIKKADYEKIKQRAKQPEYVDLFEDSLIQASRALSEERKEYIASLFNNSLTDEELGHIEYKRLLNLLYEINDIEVLILKSTQFPPMCAKPESIAFRNKHADILKEKRLYPPTSQEDRDKSTLYKTHRTNLVKLGLFKPNFKTLQKGEIPEFDKETGMIKTTGYCSTNLGRLLLRIIDLGEI